MAGVFHQGIYVVEDAIYPVVKRSTALIISMILVVAAATFVMLYHSEKRLEFAGLAIGRVDASGMDISFLVCNPSVVPIEIQGLEINLGGSSARYGSIAIEGKTVPTMSQETLEGRMDFADFTSMKSFVDMALNNQTNTDFNATLLVKEKLFGVIPYSYEKNYSPTEFTNLVFGNVQWDCKTKPNHADDIRQQLALAQARMSTASLLYSDKIGMVNETNYTKDNTTVP